MRRSILGAGMAAMALSALAGSASLAPTAPSAGYSPTPRTKYRGSKRPQPPILQAARLRETAFDFSGLDPRRHLNSSTGKCAWRAEVQQPAQRARAKARSR